MRRFLYISFALFFLVLNACSPSGSLTSSEEGANSDDVYFVEDTEDKTPVAKRPSRVKSDRDLANKKEQPDYYDPKVAEEMEWERLQRRYDPFYSRGLHEDRLPRGSSRYYRTGQRHRIYPPGSGFPQKSGSSGTGDSDSSSGSGSDGGSDNSRDRSYDTDGNSRDR